jgi:hypothetical protein
MICKISKIHSIHNKYMIHRIHRIHNLCSQSRTVSSDSKVAAREDRSNLCQAAFFMSPIDCRLYASDRAIEISTAENSHEAMHPARQFEAFAKL